MILFCKRACVGLIILTAVTINPAYAGDSARDFLRDLKARLLKIKAYSWEVTSFERYGKNKTVGARHQ